jgi:hypothetical protein
MSTDGMPKNLLVLVEYLGHKDALAVVDKLGGAMVYVPEKLRDDHYLVIALGEPLAQRLVDHFGHDRLEIPRAAAMLRAQRDIKIRAEYKNKTLNALALEYGLTRRQVLTIVGRPENDDQQPGLF